MDFALSVQQSKQIRTMDKKQLVFSRYINGLKYAMSKNEKDKILFNKQNVILIYIIS